MTDPADGELRVILAAIPDHRGRKASRHSLAAMLVATFSGLLSGTTGCTAVAQRIRDQEPSFWHAIGFCRRLPTSDSTNVKTDRWKFKKGIQTKNLLCRLTKKVFR